MKRQRVHHGVASSSKRVRPASNRSSQLPNPKPTARLKGRSTSRRRSKNSKGGVDGSGVQRPSTMRSAPRAPSRSQQTYTAQARPHHPFSFPSPASSSSLGSPFLQPPASPVLTQTEETLVQTVWHWRHKHAEERSKRVQLQLKVIALQSELHEAHTAQRRGCAKCGGRTTPSMLPSLKPKLTPSRVEIKTVAPTPSAGSSSPVDSFTCNESIGFLDDDMSPEQHSVPKQLPVSTHKDPSPLPRMFVPSTARRRTRRLSVSEIYPMPTPPHLDEADPRLLPDPAGFACSPTQRGLMARRTTQPQEPAKAERSVSLAPTSLFSAHTAASTTSVPTPSPDLAVQASGLQHVVDTQPADGLEQDEEEPVEAEDLQKAPDVKSWFTLQDPWVRVPMLRQFREILRVVKEQSLVIAQQNNECMVAKRTLKEAMAEYDLLYAQNARQAQRLHAVEEANNYLVEKSLLQQCELVDAGTPSLSAQPESAVSTTNTVSTQDARISALQDLLEQSHAESLQLQSEMVELKRRHAVRLKEMDDFCQQLQLGKENDEARQFKLLRDAEVFRMKVELANGMRRSAQCVWKQSMELLRLKRASSTTQRQAQHSLVPRVHVGPQLR